MARIIPFIMFNNQLQQALEFYTGIFPRQQVSDLRYQGKGEERQLMSARFELEEQEFYAYNGAPYFSFSPGISLFINCANQDEVDYYWQALSTGSQTNRCGWLTDPFGISWQVIPQQLGEYLSDSNPAKAQAVAAAMMQMQKIDIAQLTRAYNSCS